MQNLYNSLQHFEDAEHNLAAYASFIPKLQNLARHSIYADQLGIALLHKHFDIETDERVIRQVSNNTMTIAPQASSRKTVPWMWMAGATGYQPVEFMVSEDTPSLALETCPRLSNLRAYLKLHGLEDVFGLTRLPNSYLIANADEVFLETDAEAPRTLEIRSVPRSEIETRRTTQTAWPLKIDGLHLVCGTHCFHCDHC